MNDFTLREYITAVLAFLVRAPYKQTESPRTVQLFNVVLSFCAKNV